MPHPPVVAGSDRCPPSRPACQWCRACVCMPALHGRFQVKQLARLDTTSFPQLHRHCLWQSGP